MTASDYREEFPDFDDELPEIDGFKDSSWHNDAMPSLINEVLHLHLFVDYADPDLSEFQEARRSGRPRYFLSRLTEDNDWPVENEPSLAQGDDLAAVLEAISEYAASFSAGRKV